MIVSLVLAAALGTTPAAPPPDFPARVLRAKLVEAGLDGPAYQKKLWAQMTDPTAAALRRCIADHAPADKSPFTLVADISGNGKPASIQVQPATPVATCLATWFATLILPPPPNLADAATYPIEIDVSITP
ncbi:MAG: peptidase C13 [Rhodanobacter sp.]